MNNQDLLIIGAGGHAKSCIDVIESEGRFRIVGIVGLSDELGDKLLGYEVFATDQDLPKLVKSYPLAFVAIGQVKSPEVRVRRFNELIELGFKLPCIFAPSASVSSNSTICDGTIVLHGAVVNANAYIGLNCIINSNALIEHDVVVESHCHISTGAIVNGGVSIGEKTFIGSGAVIREERKIGNNSIVGMGAIITRDLSPNSFTLGR